MAHHIRQTRTRWRSISVAGAGLAIVAVAILVRADQSGQAPATAGTQLPAEQECRVALGTSRSPADIAWLNTCVHALSAPDPVPAGPHPMTPAATNCLLRCGFPSPLTTGVPAGTQLTEVDQDVTVTTNGAVLDRLDIHGCVFIQANDVVIRNTRITCHGAYGVRTFDSGVDFTGTLIEDTELNGDNNPESFTGMAFSNVVAVRVDIRGFENGFFFGANGMIQDSYIHDLKLISTEHPDGVQLDEGSANITLRHNTIVAPITDAAVIMYPKAGDQNHDILVDDNYLAGGGWTLYCPRQPTANIRVTNNRFGLATFGPTSGCRPPNIAAFSGNVNDLTGRPLLPA
jgi:hypothetical protein